MSKILTLALLFSSSLLALEIETLPVEKRTFSVNVELNSKIVQLSNTKHSIMSSLSGHIEEYYVKPASIVKKGDKIALIDSITLSSMSAEYLSLKEQYASLGDNFAATKKLYEKGLVSSVDLNRQSIEKDAMYSKINALESQLASLGIETQKMTKATSEYILKAHTDGIVSEILQPLHSSVSEQTPIVSITKKESYYLQSYLPLKYANEVKIGQKIVATYIREKIDSYVTQILPQLDLQTQRIILLSPISSTKNNLFINAYIPTTLYLSAKDTYPAVKKSALAFFNNEWVVFIPKEHEEEKGEHEGHDDEEEVLFEPKVIKILAQDDTFVALEGLNVGDEYVSEDSYIVKSMILKSSLDEHGH